MLRKIPKICSLFRHDHLLALAPSATIAHMWIEFKSLCRILTLLRNKIKAVLFLVDCWGLLITTCFIVLMIHRVHMIYMGSVVSPVSGWLFGGYLSLPAVLSWWFVGFTWCTWDVWFLFCYRHSWSTVSLSTILWIFSLYCVSQETTP